MITHASAYVIERDLTIGDNVERHGLFIDIALDVLRVLIHTLIEGAEEAPHTSFAGS